MAQAAPTAAQPCPRRSPSSRDIMISPRNAGDPPPPPGVPAPAPAPAGWHALSTSRPAPPSSTVPQTNVGSASGVSPPPPGWEGPFLEIQNKPHSIVADDWVIEVGCGPSQRGVGCPNVARSLNPSFAFRTVFFWRGGRGK